MTSRIHLGFAAVLKTRKLCLPRQLSLVFAAVVMLTLACVPQLAFAGVAKIGDTEFDTLQAAVDSVSGEGTIIITSDIDFATEPHATEDKAAVVIPADKNITIADDGQARTLIGVSGKGIFDVQAGGTLTLAGTSDANLILQTGDLSKQNNTLFLGTAVTNKGVFNLEHATLEGGPIGTSQTGIVFQTEKTSTFNMSGGIIQHANISRVTYYSAPVLIKGGVFNMSGGTIAHNENHSGYLFCTAGGVMLSTNKIRAEFEYPTFNMSGGSISHNSSDGVGGGVYVAAYCNFNMTGGTISDNAADYMGGGIALTGVTETTPTGYSKTGFEPQHGTFVMDGGSISGNVARNGGGIYVNIDNAYIKSGVLENNTAKFDQSPLKFRDALPHQNEKAQVVGWGHGGAIYISEQPRKLYLNNAIITENTAKPQGHSAMGGGLWACPTGTVDFRVTNGIAIYNNHAVVDDTQDAGAAGDDVAKVSLDNAQSTITLPDRLLGAGPVTWYNDGKILPASVGKADPEAPRFDVNNPGEPIAIHQSQENIAAKASVSPEAIELAEANAKVIIRNNTASHGGGIGTNGTLIMTNLDEPDWQLKVTKAWDNKVSEDAKEPVELFLTLNGKVLDSQVANAQNGWTVSFTGLPNPESLALKNFEILEGSRSVDDTGMSSVIAPETWKVSYDTVEKNDETHSLSTTVNNAGPDVPETPDIPETPDTPDTPDTPSTPNTPETLHATPEPQQPQPKPHAPQTAKQVTPATGDSAFLGGVVAVLALSGMVVAAGIRLKTRR